MFVLVFALPVMADSLRSANVTAVINDVQVYTGSSAARSAAVGETLTIPSSLQTGRKSRAELTFSDKTLTRLGQNSVFSFREGGRNVELKQGSVLLQVPKNAGGATIRTATVNASITGTTVMFEYSPGGWIKLITLEGTQKLSIIGTNQTKDLPAGKMIIMHPNAKVIPDPVNVDVRKLVATSPLVGRDIFTPLPPHVIALIDQTIKGQNDAKHKGDLIPTDHVITGAGHRDARASTSVPRADQ